MKNISKKARDLMNSIKSYCLITNPSKDELNEVFKERTRQYKKHKKIEDADSLMKDHEDDNSFHSTVWSFDRKTLLAAARIIALSDDRISESELYTSWPDWFPQRDQCVDVARLFIKSEAKNMKTVECLFRGVVINALKDNRRYITGSCTRIYVDFYKTTMNAKFESDGFHHGNVGGSKHFMFYADMNEVLRMKSSVSLMQWLQLWPKTSLIYNTSRNSFLSVESISLYIFQLPQYFLNIITIHLISFRRKKKKRRLMN